MKNDIRGYAIVRSIAQGNTLKATAISIGVSSTRTGQILRRCCREIGLSDSVEDIKKNPDIYLEKIGEPTAVEKSPLAPKTIHDLVNKLKLGSVEQLTPKYLSNITPIQLLSVGVTLTTVCDLQDWAHTCGYSLKRNAPENTEEIRAVKRAINLLDAFYFDVSVARNQFSTLIENDS